MITAKKDQQLQQKLEFAFKQVKDYFQSNGLSQNCDKTKIMVISSRKENRDDIYLETQNQKGKPTKLVYQDHIKLLGLLLTSNLKWDHLVKGCRTSLKSQLTSRLTAVKMVAKFSKPNFTRILANGLINSKLIYGLKIWGVPPSQI